MKSYVVRQGDYLAKLAYTMGFDADEVWNDPKNADLKALRDPDVLCPGDLLYIPDPKESPAGVTAGSTNTYSADIPKTKVQVVLKERGQPRANQAYVVDGVGDPVKGTTDANGQLEVEVPVHVREIQVTFPDDYAYYAVRVGDMDPLDEASGVRARLQHLGLYNPWGDTDPDGGDVDLEERDREAIAAYQRRAGLPATGVMDDATRDALKKDHGC